MADYDRNFYSRKGNKTLKFFLMVAIIILVLIGANMVSQEFYGISIIDALDKLMK